MSRNLGTIYQLLATAITTTYQAGGAKGAGAGAETRRHFSFFAQLKASGTTVTGITVKVQASIDGTSWVDLTSLNDLTAASAVDQTFSTIDGTNHTITGQLSVANVWPNLRVAMKCTGAAGQATESLTCTAIDCAA